MSWLHRLRSFVTTLDDKPLVVTNMEVKQQAAALRSEADRVVELAERASGIWPRDLVSGTYVAGIHKPKVIRRVRRNG